MGENEKKKENLFCAACSVHACKDTGRAYPVGCATKKLVSEHVKEKYLLEDFEMTQAAARTSADYTITRIEETMQFARNCNFHHLGLAFCSALSKEARIVLKIFEANGFIVESAICKVGNLHKDLVGMDAKKLLCNPIGQAELFNERNTELNVILGLCVGHDTLFIKYSQAPVTVLAVKDRVLGHNPLAAVYMADTFYKEKLFGKKD